ncbi:MFS transporter [Streptomyces cellulosae]|uniref:MFS transporter n=1 Tax=Streptomyces cellulosae TaxID=1968 RepID=UPI00068941B1|nr:MFS transporter [Streptomyces cellulosae]
MIRRLPLIALVAACGVSSCGATMTLIAVPWFVLSRTGSGIQTGAVAAAETLGLVLSVVLAGPLLDRYGAWRGSIVADLAALVAVTAIPVAEALDVLSLPVLVVLVFGIGAGRAPSRSAKQVLLPAVLAGTGVQVERATSAEETALRTGDLLGAPLGGVLIGLTGPTWVLLADGAALLTAAALVSLLVRPAAVVREPAGGARGYLRDLKQAAEHFRQDRLLLVIGVQCAALNAVVVGLLSVLLPAYGLTVWHNSTLVGVLIATSSGASILGTALYGWLGDGGHRWRVFAICSLVSGAPVFLAVAADPHPVLLVLVVSACMIANGPINPVIAAVKYARVPEELRGRVFAAFHASANAAMPLGLLLAGALLDAVGLTAAVLVLGGLCLLVTLWPFLFRIWREMDEPERPPVAIG